MVSTLSAIIIGLTWLAPMGTAALTFHILHYRRNWTVLGAAAMAAGVLIITGVVFFLPLETHAVKLDMPSPR